MADKLKLLDLFSGIGGFSLAARWTGKIETVAFCEIDPFCQKVLKKHWPDVPIINDIREVTVERIIADTRQFAEGNAVEGFNHKRFYSSTERIGENEGDRPSDGNKVWGIDLLTGGFPCQPFSVAGKRNGAADDRFLWPEMLRVIREFHPRWIIAENVPGIISIENGVVFETVCTDLESEGYSVQPFIIPACGVGAPHRRDRVWIVGHAEDPNRRRLPGSNFCEEQQGRTQAVCSDKDSHAADTASLRRESNGPLDNGEYMGQETAHSHVTCCGQWHEHWYTVAARTCVRTLDDGLPGGLVRPKGWRVNALKAAGNSIVPQVAYQIMQAILDCTEK